MKKIFGVFVFVLGMLNFAFAQEMGEGDLYMLSLTPKERAALLSGSQVETSEEEYIVEDLFTRLPLDEVKQISKAEKKIYYIDFSADWCQPCKLMDQTTFRDYEVVKFSHENFYAVQLDMTDFDAIEMQAMYNITALPTILFFDYNGNLIGRSTGMQSGTLFLSKLKEIKLNS